MTRMVHITEYDGFHEQGYYAPGDRGRAGRSTPRAGRIGVAICYDRHYPEYVRALALTAAPRSSSSRRRAPSASGRTGSTRPSCASPPSRTAYFTALCNRVGKEEWLTFAGESFVCAPSGCVIARAPALEESILHAELNIEAVVESYARKLFLRDRRPELYADWLAR